ncbi:MAG TPA: ABC transporter ATP-binding protein [Anaerolineae bacterium]|nr:ABC transporter ATP-binding protein [Anaerolineae bacterium]
MQPNHHQRLVAEDLHKTYGPREALRGLSFSLNAGRILGFLGPNGAGKTTSIRILTTILEPDKGHFVVDGTSSKYPEKIRRKIGVLPENLGLPKQITGIEYLTYFGQLYGRTRADARTYGLSLLEEVGLRQRARSLVGTYSHGMRQRLGIARALVNDPVVVFLDEPTLGLDPRGQQELLSLIQRIARERNSSIVLCSHVLPEIESVCDDVIILLEGQIIATGSVEEVMKRAQRNAVRVRVPSPSVAEAQQVLEAIPNVTGVTYSVEKAGWMGVQFENSTEEAASERFHANNMILGALIRAEIPVLSFESEGGRLQDVFLQLTEEASK